MSKDSYRLHLKVGFKITRAIVLYSCIDEIELKCYAISIYDLFW